jgi:hypothetical protein
MSYHAFGLRPLIDAHFTTIMFTLRHLTTDFSKNMQGVTLLWRLCDNRKNTVTIVMVQRYGFNMV